MNRCFASGRVPQIVAGPIKIGSVPARFDCRPLDDAKMRQAEAAVRRRYQQQYRPSRIFVSFECDRVLLVDRVEWLFGSAREQRLNIAELTPIGGAGGREYDWVSLQAERTGGGSQSGAVQVGWHHQRLSASKVDLEMVRTTMATTIRELALAGTLGISSGWASASGEQRIETIGVFGAATTPSDRTADLANRNRPLLVAEFFERAYLGSRASREQPEFIPLELAFESLPSVPSGAADGSPDPQQRALFVRQFEARYPGSEGWFRELELALAARLGGPELISWLVNIASNGSETEQGLAVAALVAITGWDARRDAAGNPQSTARAAQSYAAECRR